LKALARSTPSRNRTDKSVKTLVFESGTLTYEPAVLNNQILLERFILSLF
jgi:hypothetical protein